MRLKNLALAYELALIGTAVLLLNAWLLDGCTRGEQIVQEPSWAPSDCEGACGRLGALGCAGAEGSPGVDDIAGTADDVPCAQACHEIEAAGVTTLATACVAKASNCAAVDACLAAQTE